MRPQTDQQQKNYSGCVDTKYNVLSDEDKCFRQANFHAAANTPGEQNHSRIHAYAELTAWMGMKPGI